MLIIWHILQFWEGCQNKIQKKSFTKPGGLGVPPNQTPIKNNAKMLPKCFFFHRCCHLTEPPWQLSKQSRSNTNSTSTEREDVEAGVYPFCCLLGFHLSVRLCQDHRWGRDNLDGQQLRLLLRGPIFFLVLPATNYHNEYQYSGNILPHEYRSYKGWMES